ncbi:hypothetical protein [Prauserella muralis]|nr:hypothetical protein [Prauserella muralis]
MRRRGASLDMSGTAFSAALRQAISGSGLGLDRIQARLQERGISVSVTALSYWQSGKRQPERQSSISAVRVLEEILEVPAGALLSLLAPPRPRGTSSRRRADGAEQPLTLDSGPAAALVGLHDRCTVGDGGTVHTVTAKAVFRAGADGADRWLLTYPHNGAPPPAVRALRNCSLGRVEADTERGVVLAELLFGRCLGSGETHLAEYSLTYDHSGAQDEARTHCRQFRQPIPEYLLEVHFEPDSVPQRCWQYARAEDSPQPETRELRIGEDGTAHAVAVDFGPGRFGIGWG